MTLKEWMAAHKMSIEKMAKLSGVSVATISRVARDLNKPSAETIVKIQKATSGEVNAQSFFRN